MSEQPDKMTASQQRVHDAYLSFWQSNGYGPTYRHVAGVLGMHKSGNGVFSIVAKLIETGFMVKRDDMPCPTCFKGVTGGSSNAIAADGVSVAIVGDSVVFMLFHDGKVIESGLYSVQQVTGFCDGMKIPAGSLVSRTFELGKKRLSKLIR